MKSILERFEEKYIVHPETGCWLWAASLFPKGYPSFNGVRGHRWSYEYFIGKIPKGLQLDHLCKVKNCVNPKHLEPVTNLENNRRSELTLAGKNRRKTHCPKGHEYTSDNIYIRPSREIDRQCRKCMIEATRKYQHKLKIRRKNCGMGIE
jgi:HNH endonuclease